ncbi:hypothetical protein V502_00643 [Pseudogymnoascus sp. VKM F-4520 (FW-2644)]|nr:hypothetical protein V502_00643 [Pseudogymnoascus sp. VKM F-4520 (FW-2644)]
MTEHNIQGGFRGAGLYSHNPEAVLSKLDVKLKTPTPPGTAHSEPEPWFSRTPNNPIEATSQSEYIKNRIARHQNSSPTSIISAVDQLAKGAQTIMHKLTLVQSEVQLMQGELETLSKRRRAKKTRLRQGGCMSIAEAEDLQAQNEVNMQMKQETQQSSGWKPRVDSAPQRCRTCSKTGHNSRTCQIIVVISEDSCSD